MLPYFEQGSLANLFDFKQQESLTSPSALKAAATPVDIFLCPSDTEPAVHEVTTQKPIESMSNFTWAGTNYAINGSSGTGTWQNCDPFGNETDGLCYAGAKLRFAQVTDGLSNTLAFTESLRGPCGDALIPTSDSDDVQIYVGYLSAPSDLMPTADSGEASGYPAINGSIKNWYTQRLCNWYLMSTTPGPVMNGRFPPNTGIPDLGAFRVRVTAARSRHPGGVNAAMADGSVQFYTDSVGSPAWHALWTRAGGENNAEQP